MPFGAFEETTLSQVARGSVGWAEDKKFENNEVVVSESDFSRHL